MPHRGTGHHRDALSAAAFQPAPLRAEGSRSCPQALCVRLWRPFVAAERLPGLCEQRLQDPVLPGENFLSERNMKQAENVRKQLASIARKAKLEDASGEMLTHSIRRAFIEGFFMQCAHLDESGKHYLTVRDQQMVAIHPSSFLQHKPEWVLYHETVVTDRCYMRNATTIPPEMLIEASPKFYHPERCKLHEHARKILRRALPRVKS
ncbi:unnamed protein product [Effrenium voratum]|nr:unnamed protein product [Effrenium voratum]